jgi:hypothetical protein
MPTAAEEIIKLKKEVSAPSIILKHGFYFFSFGTNKQNMTRSEPFCFKRMNRWRLS